MNESLLVIGTWWKNKTDGRIGYITDMQYKESLVIIRYTDPSILASETRVGSYCKYDFLRQWEILPSHADDIPVKVDSIWKSNKTGNIVKVLIGPEVSDSSVYYINLNDATGYQGMSHMDKAAFIEEHTFLRDNDNGALYRRNKNPNMYLKVIETTKKQSWFMGVMIAYVKYRVIEGDSVKDDRECVIATFHSCCHLLSLDPEKENAVPMDSAKTIKVDANDPNKVEDETIAPQQVTWDGAIWYHTIGGVHVAITIKEENDVVWYVSSDNKGLGIYWQMPRDKWVNTYILYEGTVKPTCYPEGSFDKMVEETKESYEKVVKMLKEGEILRNKAGIHFGLIENEPIMDDSKETYLKTDESKMKEFSSGAKREDKSGKGRYDLIPGDIMSDFVDYAWDTYFNEGSMTICDTDVSLSAYFDDMTNEKLFFEFILNMTCLFFTKLEDLDETTDCVGERSYVVTWEDFHDALYEMREALAKHYEAGAKVHGVNNWKKGIPISDSERGGNFVDSMRRHTDQALRGLTDEPHPISAIWNAFAAVWTLRNNKQESK